MSNSPFRIQGMGIDSKAMMRCWKQWIKQGKNWNDLDRVILTEPQVITLVEDVIETDFFSSDTLKRPSIPEFTAIISEAVRRENTYICYRKTLMNEDDFIAPVAEATIVPYVDAYCYVNNGGTICNCVVTICAVTLNNPETGQVLTCSAQTVSYYHNDPYTEFMLSDMDYFNEFARSIKGLYMAVQQTSLERPEVLVSEGVAKVEKTETVRRKGRYKRVRKTRMVKLIRVSDAVTARRDPKKHREITCPCWGVAGHMRTYKTGKQVWIKPYRKGKQRHNPAAYEPKEYLLPEEE